MWARVDGNPGYHAARRKQKKPCNIASEMPQADLWRRKKKKKRQFSSEMFMRGLGREIHHCRESNLCPAWDSDWHLPHHKETLVPEIPQPTCIPLLIWAGKYSWWLCPRVDEYKLLSEMILLSGTTWKITCDTFWWANHFLKWGEHIVLCLPLLFFNEQGYFWLRSLLWLTMPACYCVWS